MAVVAQMLHDAPADMINYLIYPDQNPNNQSYILNQLNNYQNLIQDTEQQYMEKARQLYDSIQNSHTARMARAAMRSIKGALRPNVICELTDLNDVRSAQPIMQQYIMAQPAIRQLYHEQRCDGYSDSYNDYSPGVIGFGHNDYMAVMDGIMEDTADDGWKISTYAYDLMPNDRVLTFDQKVDILHTWQIIELAISAGEDCTDIQEGRL